MPIAAVPARLAATTRLAMTVAAGSAAAPGGGTAVSDVIITLKTTMPMTELEARAISHDETGQPRTVNAVSAGAALSAAAGPGTPATASSSATTAAGCRAVSVARPPASSSATKGGVLIIDRLRETPRRQLPHPADKEQALSREAQRWPRALPTRRGASVC